jgi:hypothetical protein
MTLRFINSSKWAVSILKVIGFPLSVSILLPLTSGSAFALPLSTSTDLPQTLIQLISKEVEQTEEEERSTQDIPDVIIDDEKTQPEDSASPTDTESDDESSTPVSNDPRFTCQVVNDEYTVMYHPESQPDDAYPWAIPRQMGGGWSAQRRCNEISRRLESYREDGLLELSTSVENNYNIVCVTTQKDPSCRIVFTVPDGQDPMLTRDRVFQNLTTADRGQQTQGVNTFTDSGQSSQWLNQLGQLLNQDLSSLTRHSISSNGIDLRPFLDPADGGTGTKLQGSSFTPSNSQRLKPENFR